MELWDVLDRKGNFTGRTIVRGQPLPPGAYHLAVHAWIVDSHNRFLIQKRADHLQLFPGIWATAGGSAITGEDSETAMIRELREELGITVVKGEMRKIGRIVRKDNFVDLWLLRKDLRPDCLRLQPEEVSSAKYVDLAQLQSMTESGLFHDYGSKYMNIVLQVLR